MRINYHTNDRALHQAVEDFAAEWKNHSESIVVQTSGSTGAPKEIELNKKHMITSARRTGEFLGLQPGMTALLCMSPKTIAGKMMIVRALVLDLTLVVSDVSASPLVGLNESIDFAAMVPLQAQQSLNETPEQMRSIGKLIIGGGPVSTTLQSALARVGVTAWQTFGMTETISHVAMRSLEQEDPVYEALPGIRFSLVDEALVIHAPHLGIEQLQTNDIVTLIDATHFRWMGRKDFVINSGGVKIHPERIEQQLSSILDAPYFSFGIDDERLGQRHCLAIEGTPLAIEKATFIALLAPYTIPKEIYYFPTFAHTESGKINRIETLKCIENAHRQVL